ncbi:hypothetical protein QTP88_021543 [Uroleucon formosanum]
MGAHFWLENEWPSFISKFSPSDVFNGDETGLYFRALPEHTYVLQNDKAKGTKSCKERIIILCCASMTGEKKKLLVVGKRRMSGLGLVGGTVESWLSDFEVVFLLEVVWAYDGFSLLLIWLETTCCDESFEELSVETKFGLEI